MRRFAILLCALCLIGSAGDSFALAKLLRVPHSPTPTATPTPTGSPVPTPTPTPTPTPSPAVVTTAATGVGQTGATLNGTVNPKGAATDYHFEYGTSLAYGSATTTISAGSGTAAVPESAGVTGLPAGTLQHFRIVASSTGGMNFGNDVTFTTTTPPPTPTPTPTPQATPTVVTQTITNVTSSSMQFNGTVNPNGAATTVRFNWGTTTSYGQFTTTTGIGSGTVPVTVSSTVTGLTPATAYHAQIVGINSGGTALGADATATTTTTPTPTPSPTPTATPTPTAIPAVYGVYVLPTSLNPVQSTTLANADVKGISIGGRWKDLEPTQGNYSWTAFDTEAARVAAAGKNILVRVAYQGGSATLGGNTPNDVFTQAGADPSATTAMPGVTYSWFDGAKTHTFMVFWNPTFVARKLAFINAFSAHIATLSSTIRNKIFHVAVSFANSNSEDWSVPNSTVPETGYTRSQVQRWLDSTTDPVNPGAGYTTDKMITVGKQMITATINAYPGKIVDLPIGTMGHDLDVGMTGGDTDYNNYVPKTVIAWANTAYNHVLAVARNSVAAKMGNPPGTESLGLLYSTGAGGNHVMGQMLWRSYADPTYRNNNGSNTNLHVSGSYPNPTVTDEEIGKQSLDQGHGYAMEIVEIYEVDVTNMPAVVTYGSTLLAP